MEKKPTLMTAMTREGRKDKFWTPLATGILGNWEKIRENKNRARRGGDQEENRCGAWGDAPHHRHRSPALLHKQNIDFNKPSPASGDPYSKGKEKRKRIRIPPEDRPREKQLLVLPVRHGGEIKKKIQTTAADPRNVQLHPGGGKEVTRRSGRERISKKPSSTANAVQHAETTSVKLESKGRVSSGSGPGPHRKKEKK